MNKHAATCLLIIASAISVANTAPHFLTSDQQSFDIVGEAFSLSDQRLIYREYHQVDGNQHLVIYQDPNGKEFSRKAIDYSTSLQAPSFKQRNNWSGETISVDHKMGEVTLSYQNDRNKTDNTETLATNKPLIIDAGFHHYIQNNWLSLMDGQVTVFDFALADRQDLIALKIERSNCPSTIKTSSPSKVCFSIGANNRFIRWLIGSLNLVYAQDTRQLLRFTGLANINDQQGKGLKVDIHYYYPSTDVHANPKHQPHSS